jgi:transposase
MTHYYKRHGTTTLFAALDVLTGAVIGQCLPRHTNTEFLQFLKKVDKEVPAGLAVHVIFDNCGTHNHPNIRAGLAKHPWFHLHFTPTSSSWLNLVERWLRELTEEPSAAVCSAPCPSWSARSRTTSTPTTTTPNRLHLDSQRRGHPGQGPPKPSCPEASAS